MLWLDRWKLILNSVTPLPELASVYLAGVRTKGMDFSSVGNSTLIPGIKKIASEIEKFRKEFDAVLPSDALQTIDLFLKNFSIDTGIFGVVEGVSKITMLANELAYQLSDQDISYRTVAERCFVHLQRSIVANASFRKDWQAAYEFGEVACEKLGALHLLAQGLWAFKISAEGARTDLVIHDTSLDIERVAKTQSGLVLTEWKKAELKNALEKCAEARAQIKLYSSGVLAGLELKTVRYVIIVTRDWVTMPADEVEKGVTYRYINVAVEPSTPSVASRA